MGDLINMWILKKFRFLFVFFIIIITVGCNNSPTLLLSGDSITHGFGTDNFGACKVTNIAKGGGGVRDAYQSVNEFKGKKTSAIIIAIGINDAKRRILSSNFFEDWSKDYLKIVNEAKLKSSHIYLSTIIPIEENIEPYGNYADKELINHLNIIIKDISKTTQSTLIDSNSEFSQMNKFTIDGVHLNPIGYTHLRQIWAMEVAECRQ